MSNHRLASDLPGHCILQRQSAILLKVIITVYVLNLSCMLPSGGTLEVLSDSRRESWTILKIINHCLQNLHRVGSNE